MLKVVSVVDKKGTALDRLAQGVAPYHDNIEYVVCDVHPKRPDEAQLERFMREAISADIIDYQYFRTANLLRSLFPWLESKKSILTHNNPYSYKDAKWDWANFNVGNNTEITKGLEAQGSPHVRHIPITVDAYFWHYRREFKPNRNVIMVANRIESKKGILPVAIACGDAGLKLILVGAISDRNYFYDILQTGCVEFYEQIPDEKLRELYHESTIHVCNSVDGFESGTMPILEAMLCGTPVLTRNIGHVPDINNGDNLTIYEGDPEDTIAIRQALETMLEDTKKLEVQRSVAWNTAKNFNFERRAYEYQKLYRELQDISQTPVSVIVPIYDNSDVIRKCLTAIANQTYTNIEIVVCDDNPKSNSEVIDEFKKTVNIPVRYLHTAGNNNDYGLARARNAGIIFASGDIVCFCDQRQIMAPDAVEKLVASLVPRTWVYGDKGGAKKDFVENFSAINRDEIIRAGMFCERVDGYGGMSQEVRSRTRMQGIRHVYIEEAKATPMGKSSNKNAKKNEIIKMKNMLARMGL